jgi:hypothetical protein
MPEFLRDMASERKVRLFACACCRRISHFLTHERSREAVEVGERFADGNATLEDLASTHDAAYEIDRDGPWVSVPGESLDTYEVRMAHCCAAKAAVHAARPDGMDYGFGKLPYDAVSAFLHAARPAALTSPRFVNEHYREQTILLREIFGNPFRPVTISPHWLTPTVASIAQAIYTDRAFDRLPILADALEEAGCANADILTQCQGPWPHVRGCWVVDVILGKE